MTVLAIRASLADGNTLYETPPLKGVDQMCLNCGCMRAHDDMGKPGINITYEDVKRAAEANGTTIAETLETIARTSDKDRAGHPEEYVGLGQHPGSIDPKPGQESSRQEPPQPGQSGSPDRP